MDLDAGSLISGLVIGAVGLGLFIYGKKQADSRCLIVGLVMCVFPYFVASVALMWVLAAACVGGLYALVKYA